MLSAAVPLEDEYESVFVEEGAIIMKNLHPEGMEESAFSFGCIPTLEFRSSLNSVIAFRLKVRKRWCMDAKKRSPIAQDLLDHAICAIWMFRKGKTCATPHTTVQYWKKSIFIT
ncbi:hypothetical protein Tcan_00971, partial [Toxocara canis]